MTPEELNELEEQEGSPSPYPCSDDETNARINWKKAHVVPIRLESIVPATAPQGPLAENRIMQSAASRAIHLTVRNPRENTTRNEDNR